MTQYTFKYKCRGCRAIVPNVVHPQEKDSAHVMLIQIAMGEKYEHLPPLTIVHQCNGREMALADLIGASPA